MYGGIVVELETLPKTQGTAAEPETVAKFPVWLLNEPETLATVMALAVAEPATVANFTVWVVAAHETVFEFMAKSLQSLRRSQNSWHGGCKSLRLS